jgi:hypothetical protein
MTPDEAQRARYEALAKKRRQAYWKRRRAVLRASAAPALTAASRMEPADLWIHLDLVLQALVVRLEAGSSAEMYGYARQAVEYADELFKRGEQLRLPL